MGGHRAPCCLCSTSSRKTSQMTAVTLLPGRIRSTGGMVTPNRDRSVSIARLEEDWEKAKLKGQGEIDRWESQHLNMEIGLALRSERWVGADYWERAADKTLTLQELL